MCYRIYHHPGRLPAVTVIAIPGGSGFWSPDDCGFSRDVVEVVDRVVYEVPGERLDSEPTAVAAGSGAITLRLAGGVCDAPARWPPSDVPRASPALSGWRLSGCGEYEAGEGRGPRARRSAAPPRGSRGRRCRQGGRAGRRPAH